MIIWFFIGLFGTMWLFTGWWVWAIVAAGFMWYQNYVSQVEEKAANIP